MRELAKTAALIGLALLLFGLTWAEDPINFGGIEGNDWGPQSPADMRATAATIERHTDPGEHVFVVLSTYYALADRDVSMHSPRAYYMVDKHHGQELGWNRTAYAGELERRLTAELRTGETTHVIMTPRTHTMLARWQSARTAFLNNFCRIRPTPSAYRPYHVNAYRYVPDADCQPSVQWPWDMPLRVKKVSR